VCQKLISEELPGGGSCAVVALVVGGYLYSTWVGDSRCVYERRGKTYDLSIDHKPDDPQEKERIESRGGTVFNHRVNGMLAVSRAFGNLPLRLSGALDAEPDQAWCKAISGAKIVLASDGVWDVYGDDHEGALATGRMIANPYTAASNLVKQSLRKGSKDNITVVWAILN
jgi:serine/threonine protein phosphatase PrpC